MITSNSSALKEIAEGYAQLVDPLDIEQMARAIVQNMADPDHRAKLAQLGLKRAKDFRWGKTATQTLQVYRNLLQHPRSSLASEKEGSFY